MTIDNGNTYTAEDTILGAQVLSFTIGLVGWVVACLVAWSFTGFWAVLGMYVLMSIIMTLISWLISIAACLALGDEGVAKIGAFCSTTCDTVVGWFASDDKAAPAAA